MDTEDSTIYLDHAATTFPRPSDVIQAMCAQYARMGCSPGRGGYDLAVEAGEFVHSVRKRVAGFFGATDPERVCFAANATEALNLGIFGLTRPGMHVISSRLEHNSVLRPLHHLHQSGYIEYTLVDFDADGFIHPEHVYRAMRPHTGLVVLNHASNVLGSVQPIPEVGRICAEHGVPLLIDTAQSAGYIPIDMISWKVSAVAFTGHKALLGPSGIGGLAVAPDLDVASTRFGGTGSDSHSLEQPHSFPQRLEAGTLNVIGIMGLNAGLDYLDSMGMTANHARKMSLLARLRQGLEALDGVTVYGSISQDRHVPVLCCSLAGKSPSDVGMILDGDHGIAVRTGLHCAPLVHRDIGTAREGAVRFSLGWDTTVNDIDLAVAAIAGIQKGA
jgi:cysteine desulfurase family protein